MININATVYWKGYNPNDLKSTSSKRVWANCDVCGIGRWIEYRHNSPVCRSCSCKGIKRSDESKKKMSAARSGRNLSEEHKQKIRDAAEKKRRQRIPIEYVCSDCGALISKNSKSGKCKGCCQRGNHLSESHKKAISKANLGKKHTDDHKKNLSIAMKGKQSGVNNPMYGRNHTKESKRKISETKLNKPGSGMKKIKTISSYICYDRDAGKEVVWRQKIDQNGRVQGTGFFLIRIPGKGSFEQIRLWSMINTAKRRLLGFYKISKEHKGCVWHHVTKKYVVAMPEHIHSKIHHKQGENMLEGVLG